ncbi:MAG TPA: Gmad2 immunoglobulin-like domain-containing protein [Actinomycetota bacterium]|nr:Gmad2 immunoglobulin-like domain-containing protein [Actinomycetota bacterium]
MKRLFVLITALGLLAGACAESGPGGLGPVPTTDPTTSPTSTPSPGPDEPGEPSPTPTSIDGETMTYEVWFASGDGWLFPTHRTGPANPAVGRASLMALLAGPDQLERAAGVSSAVPAGSELLDLSISDGTATVDLSSEFESGGGSLSVTMRLAQLVYTLTQFPTVDRVSLELDGEPVEVFSGEGVIVDPPMTRKTFEDLLPPIVVESLTIGQRVSSPVTIAGSANVFEATVSISIYDAEGNEIVRTFTTATCGTGCRGTYSEAVRFEVDETQPGVIEVYESSAEDGSKLHAVRIDVILEA